MNDSEKILSLITALKLKRKDFAEQVGLTTGGVSHILSGTHGISRILQTAITLRYNVNPSWWTDDNAPMFAGEKPDIIRPDLKELYNLLESVPKKDLPKVKAIIEQFVKE